MIGIFFDVDGTLADTFKLGYDSTNEVLNGLGLEPVSEESYHEGTKFTTPRRMAWHVTGDPDNIVGHSLAIEFDRLYVDLVSQRTAALFPGVKDLLLEIASMYPGVQYGALSNACTDYVSAVLQVNGLSTLFPVAYGPDKVTAAKPAPDGLIQIADTLHISTANCVYIGDSPTDGQAARAAGMRSIGVTWGSHSVDKVVAAFDKTVYSIEELKSAILDFLVSQGQ